VCVVCVLYEIRRLFKNDVPTAGITERRMRRNCECWSGIETRRPTSNSSQQIFKLV